MKRVIPESELMINPDGSVFHLHIRPEEIEENIILVGDPGRVDMVASFFDEIRFRNASREFISVTGSYKSMGVTVLSTGIGTDNIDIVMNELDALVNIDFTTRTVKEKHTALRILRIGTSGAVQPDIPVGSMVFSRYSAGFDGLLNWYANREKVTCTDMEEAFVKETGWLDILPRPYFVKSDDSLASLFEKDALMGITMSASGFYGPQGRVLRIPLSMPDMLDRFERFSSRNLKITNFEMESSAVAGLAAHLGHRAATVCCIIANRNVMKSNTDYNAMIRGVVGKSLDLLSKNRVPTHNE